MKQYGYRKKFSYSKELETTHLFNILNSFQTLEQNSIRILTTIVRLKLIKTQHTFVNPKNSAFGSPNENADIRAGRTKCTWKRKQWIRRNIICLHKSLAIYRPPWTSGVQQHVVRPHTAHLYAPSTTINYTEKRSGYAHLYYLCGKKCSLSAVFSNLFENAVHELRCFCISSRVWVCQRD